MVCLKKFTPYCTIAHDEQHGYLKKFTSCWTIAHDEPTITIEFKGMDFVTFHILLEKSK